MKTTFENITGQRQNFFNILPEDWQGLLYSMPENIMNSAEVHILKAEGKIVAGGIVFADLLPDMAPYPEVAEYWYGKDYLYIGYLWVPEELRSLKLGSNWIAELFKKYPGRKYWLTIEEYNLRYFYEKNNFKFIRKLEFGNNEEWLMATD